MVGLVGVAVDIQTAEAYALSAVEALLVFITGFKLNNDTEYDQRLFHAINYGWREV